MRILGIIPARSGSKGIENKNFYPICGVPMIEFTIGAATNSNLDHVIVSTDYDLSLFENVSAIKRPYELCTDDAKTIDVIKHVAKRFPDYDAYMILQPTSPLRSNEDINGAIELFKGTDALLKKCKIPINTSLYSGYYMGIKHKDKTYDKRQDKPHFQRNGAIFITTRALLEQGKLWDENAMEYVMPKSRSVDVDDLDDMKIAEALLMYDLMNDSEG